MDVLSKGRLLEEFFNDYVQNTPIQERIENWDRHSSEQHTKEYLEFIDRNNNLASDSFTMGDIFQDKELIDVLIKRNK